jgi:hypothetical protein
LGRPALCRAVATGVASAGARYSNATPLLAHSDTNDE